MSSSNPTTVWDACLDFNSPSFSSRCRQVAHWNFLLVCFFFSGDDSRVNQEESFHCGLEELYSQEVGEDGPLVTQHELVRQRVVVDG